MRRITPSAFRLRSASYGGRGRLALLDHKPLMVRSAKRVSNHEATDGPASFETRALRAPQDEGRARSSRAGLLCMGLFSIFLVGAEPAARQQKSPAQGRAFRSLALVLTVASATARSAATARCGID